MVHEVLTIPQSMLAETIQVVRSGLANRPDISEETRAVLVAWVKREEAYLEHLAGKDKEAAGDERA